MAQRIETFLEDDLNGGPADGTVFFGLDGKAYEIDLSAANASKLRAEMGPYLEGARKLGRVGAPPAHMTRTRSTSDRERSAEIRTWARERGISVNDRGRIPQEITSQWEAETAGGTRTPPPVTAPPVTFNPPEPDGAPDLPRRRSTRSTGTTGTTRRGGRRTTTG
jgi:hypothetical protein